MDRERDGEGTISNLRTLNGLQEPLPLGQRAFEETISGMETMREGGSMWLAGRYKVVRRLGEGGMGSVWLAEDTKLDNRQVAIKMLPAVMAGKKGFYRQVKQEALMAMKLSHPNIATVRAFDEDEGGSPFLVIDYIEGTGLDDILAEKGALGEAETLKLLGPVAAALDYAHAKGVVHRDVKPGNVIVDKNGTPYVLDFGIAREIQETMTQVTGKFSSGTLMYMSPEQLRGRAPKAAQDVYSFAAMAYECLTGTPPFSRGQIEWQIVNNPPEPLPEDAAGGVALRMGVMAGLAKEPEKRPGTCMGVLGRDEAAKREREKREAEEALRKREAEAIRAREQARAEEVQRRQQEETERLARERARVEEAERRREATALEAERAARKRAEAEAMEARRKAQTEEFAAQQAQEARGRAAGWAWFLAIVLVVGGLAAYGWWQQEQERAQPQVQRLLQENEAARRAKQEAEARRKAEQERQMKPSILLKATLNGREVAATVTEGVARSGLTTPVTVNLEVGGSYSFAMEYEEGGRKYAGRRTVMAKDRGVTDAAVVLEEVKEDVAGRTKTITLPGGATMEMVWCPAGSFSMGSNNGDNDEKPVHEVRLPGFWMAKTEVTQGQWKSVMGSNPAHFQKGDNYPVECVSWDAAQEFCRKARNGLSLPTEAEWEYACRAGTTGDYAGSLDQMAWYGEDWETSTHPVGTKEANAWGLHDMHGNVWEWCEDWYGRGYYAESPGGDPQGPASGGGRVFRGGCCWDVPQGCRSAGRGSEAPSEWGVNFGFRPVLRQN